jgi:glycosyltransferase involved in cell wall biosynthesis
VVVLVAGRLVRSKRVDLVLDAVASVHDVQVLVVGHGELHDELQQRVAELDLGSRVCFAGFVDDDALPALFASADLVASASEYEGFGLTLVEAMACGLPVVATAVGGVTDVVEPGATGTLVPFGDVAAMAEQICLLADDAGLRARWGSAGRRRAVERFSLRALGAGFTEAYRAAVGEQGRRWGG